MAASAYEKSQITTRSLSLLITALFSLRLQVNAMPSVAGDRWHGVCKDYLDTLSTRNYSCNVTFQSTFSARTGQMASYVLGIFWFQRTAVRAYS